MKKEIFEALKKNGFDVEGTLKRFMNNEDLYMEVLQKYRSDKNCVLLEQCLQNKKYTDAYIAAHALKGVCKNLGMNQLLISLEPMVSLLKKPEESKEWERKVSMYSEELKEAQKDVVALLLNLE